MQAWKMCLCKDSEIILEGVRSRPLPKDSQVIVTPPLAYMRLDLRAIM